MIPVMSRIWMPATSPYCWDEDLNVSLDALGDRVEYQSFTTIENSNGGLNLLSANTSKASVLALESCPVVSDFDLEFGAIVRRLSGSSVWPTGWLVWRDTTPGDASTAESANFAMQFGRTGTGSGTPFISLLYGTSQTTGWTGNTQITAPDIVYGTESVFRLRVEGQSVKVWCNDTQIYDASNTNAGESSYIWMGNETHGSSSGEGPTTFTYMKMICL